jgi:hypothetical protein
MQLRLDPLGRNPFLRDVRNRSDWMVDDAVCCEVLSAASRADRRVHNNGSPTAVDTVVDSRVGRSGCRRPTVVLAPGSLGPGSKGNYPAFETDAAGASTCRSSPVQFSRNEATRRDGSVCSNAYCGLGSARWLTLPRKETVQSATGQQVKPLARSPFRGVRAILPLLSVALPPRNPSNEGSVRTRFQVVSNRRRISVKPPEKDQTIDVRVAGSFSARLALDSRFVTRNEVLNSDPVAATEGLLLRRSHL